MVGAPATPVFDDSVLDDPVLDDPVGLLAAVLQPAGTSSGLVALGGPGVGKSRLLHAARSLAERQGLPVREINPTEATATIPFGCLADVLCRRRGGRDPRLQLHLVVGALCAEAGRDGRLLLFVDDVPRLDALSAAAIHYVLKASRAFLVGTALLDAGWPEDLALLRDQGVIATSALGSNPSATEAVTGSAGEVPALRRSGKYWSIEFRGVGSSLRHLTGLTYLAQLLDRPARPVAALQLVSSEAPLTTMSPQPVIDTVSRRSLERRALVLIDELARLRSTGDSERIGALEAEALWIERLLTTSTRPDGSSRVFATIDERARTAVRKAIVRALDEIDAADAAAAAYLRPRVTTGFECCFTP